MNIIGTLRKQLGIAMTALQEIEGEYSFGRERITVPRDRASKALEDIRAAEQEKTQ